MKSALDEKIGFFVFPCMDIYSIYKYHVKIPRHPSRLGISTSPYPPLHFHIPVFRQVNALNHHHADRFPAFVAESALVDRNGIFYVRFNPLSAFLHDPDDNCPDKSAPRSARSDILFPPAL